MIFEWRDSNIEKPDKNCGVLVCYIYNKGTNIESRHYEVVGYSTNLYKLDKYDFISLKKSKDKSGFYRYDSEYGYTETYPDAWCYIPDYIN